MYFRNREMSIYKRKSQFVVWQRLIQKRWWTDNISGIDLATICQSQAFKANLKRKGSWKWDIKISSLTMDARIEAIPSCWYQSRAVLWGSSLHSLQSSQKPGFMHQCCRKNSFSSDPRHKSPLPAVLVVLPVNKIIKIVNQLEIIL